MIIETKYGEFKDSQMKNYKKKLHDKMFWLLLYKDPKTKDNFPNVDDTAFRQYFEYLMKEIDGLNELLLHPKEIVEIMSLLEAALIETEKPSFDYKAYRKLVLDAHHLVDNISKEV